MKKYLSVLVCCILAIGLVGCGNNGDKKPTQSNEKPKEETKKTESDLDIVGKKFTLDTDSTEASVYGLAKDGNAVKFKMFVTLEGDDKTVADALGAKVGDLVYNVNGDDSETYLVNQNKVLVTFKDTTAEEMKKSMDDYLSKKGVTLEQVKNAMKEKFKVK